MRKVETGCIYDILSKGRKQVRCFTGHDSERRWKTCSFLATVQKLDVLLLPESVSLFFGLEESACPLSAFLRVHHVLQVRASLIIVFPNAMGPHTGYVAICCHFCKRI